MARPVPHPARAWKCSPSSRLRFHIGGPTHELPFRAGRTITAICYGSVTTKLRLGYVWRGGGQRVFSRSIRLRHLDDFPNRNFFVLCSTQALASLLAYSFTNPMRGLSQLRPIGEGEPSSSAKLPP